MDQIRHLFLFVTVDPPSSCRHPKTHSSRKGHCDPVWNRNRNTLFGHHYFRSPSCLLFNNQGYAKQDFRAALGVIRVAESSLTAIAYGFIGFYSAGSMDIIPYIVPSVIVGIPLGTYLIRLMDPETFRRICMAFDGLVVGFGLSRVLVELDLATPVTTYSILSIVVLINGYLLFRFFRDRGDPQHILS